MAGLIRLATGFVVCLTLVASVNAFGGRSYAYHAPSSVGYAYYYYVWPTYPYYCVPTGPTILPVPDARPTPAPPSTGEPPLKGGLDSPMPKIIATRGSSASPLDSDRCKVGFWNLSGRDVKLTVDGKSWTLPKNREVTLEVDRQFGWQVDQQPLRSERVPAGHASFEVLIRE